ncbi:MAG: hypothetical protein R3C61_28000 [Bacteroidia bacterium]
MNVIATHTHRMLFFSLVVPLITFLAFGMYGFCDTDQGFIQALSWRVVNGQIPFRDFISVRPPLSIYLHALPMLIFPAQWVVLVERAIFYLMISLSVFWMTRSLERYFDFKEIGLSPEAFAFIAFICSVHNFPPMPWHTVDGIFFASWGVNLICRKTSAAGLLGGIALLTCAALCKQAFYPMIPAGLFLMWFLREKKPALWATFIWLAVLAAGMVIVYIRYPELPGLFWEQTTGATTLEDLFSVGIIRYAKPFVLIVLPLLIIWRAHGLYDRAYLPVLLYGLVFFGLLGLHVYHTLVFHAYTGPSYGFSQAFFLIAAGVSVKGFWVNPRAFALLLVLLLVSWCTGISWGYANNMLCFTPVIFGLIYWIYEEFNFTVPRYFYGIIAVILIWIFAILNEYPYRDAPRESMKKTIGDVFPRMSGIYTGDGFHNKAEELKKMTESRDGLFTVLPAWPLAHYVTETMSPFPADWAHNAEVNYNALASDLQSRLNQDVDFVLIEKDKINEARNSGPYGSLITGYVLDHWTPCEHGAFFDVYCPPTR